jgi:hypothetical protein
MVSGMMDSSPENELKKVVEEVGIEIWGKR